MQEKFYWLIFVNCLRARGLTKKEFLEQASIPKSDFLECFRSDKNPPKEWLFEIVRVLEFPYQRFYRKDIYESELRFLEDCFTGRNWTSLPPCQKCGSQFGI